MSEELLERARSAERVSRFAQSIALQLALPGVIATAIERTRELCDAEGASLLLVDPATGDLCFDTVAGPGASALVHHRIQAGQGIAGRVAQRAEAVRVPDVRADPTFDPQLDKASGFTTGSIIAVPLIVGGDVLGVLEAVRGPEAPPFDEVHLKRLGDLAPHVAIAVHNAQMTLELQRTQVAVLTANADLERKVQERTLQISRGKKEWESTFDAIHEPIAILDGFTVLRANQAYARRAALPVTQLPGRRCHELLAGRQTPCPGCPLVRAGAEKPSGEIHLPDGTHHRFSSYSLPGEGTGERRVVHYQDVTQRRELESRLRESERLASLGQLASGAAHEINNPIGFVTSNLRSLQTSLAALRPSVDAVEPAGEGAAHSELEDALEMIEESLEGVRRVTAIVQGLRELARLEIGNVEATCVNSSVSRAIRAVFPDGDVATLLAPEAKGLIPPLQLDRALIHLLENARQAVAPGQRVRVSTVTAGDEVVIEVLDEGCGISDENQRRIFEPFFTTRGVGKGIGLGLTAAYGIVKRVGGDIGVRSQPGRGSCFTIRLPRASPRPHANA